MPVSIIDASANQASANFLNDLGAVFSGLAEAQGTPYPYALVAEESQVRVYGPGSLFKLKDGSYGWTSTLSSVRKEALSETADIYIIPFGAQAAKKWTAAQLQDGIQSVVFGCLCSGPDSTSANFHAGCDATKLRDSKGVEVKMYVPVQRPGEILVCLADANGGTRNMPLEQALVEVAVPWCPWTAQPLQLEVAERRRVVETSDFILRDAVLAFSKAHPGTSAEQIEEAFRSNGPDQADAQRYVNEASRRVDAALQALGFSAPTNDELAVLACGIAELPEFAPTLEFCVAALAG